MQLIVIVNYTSSPCYRWISIEKNDKYRYSFMEFDIEA